MRKNRRLMQTAAAGLLTVMLLAGCTQGAGNTDEGAKEEAGKTKIDFVIWNGNHADSYKRAQDHYNSSQDEIELSVGMETGDYNTYLGAKTAANDLPDLFVVTPYSQVEQFAKSGKIVDLSDQPFVDRIYPNTKEACMYDGKIYAYPLAQDFMGMFYNVEYFDKAGIKEIPKTIDEFEEVCKKLEKAGYTPIAATYKDTEALNHVFSCLLGAAVNENSEDWIASMQSEGGSFDIKNKDFIFRFCDILKKYSGDNYMDADYSAGYNTFVSGDAAMLLSGEWSLLNLMDVNPDAQMGVFAVPLTDKPEDAKLDVDVGCALVVNADSPNVDAALKVLDAVSSQDADGWNSFTANNMGASVSGIPFKGSFTAPYLTDYSRYMDEGMVRPWIYQRLKAGAATIIGESIQGYFAETMSEDEVISEMDTRYNELVSAQ